MCDDQLVIPVEQLVKLSTSNQATAEQLSGMVHRLGVYLIQLDARMRKQEELLQRRVTVSSAQYKQLMAAARRRSTELCAKYQLPGSAGAKIRAAIKKDILARWNVKDLHDLPENALGEALAGMNAWDSYSFVQKLRQAIETEARGHV